MASSTIACRDLSEINTDQQKKPLAAPLLNEGETWLVHLLELALRKTRPNFC